MYSQHFCPPHTTYTLTFHLNTLLKHHLPCRSPCILPSSFFRSRFPSPSWCSYSQTVTISPWQSRYGIRDRWGKPSAVSQHLLLFTKRNWITGLLHPWKTQQGHVFAHSPGCFVHSLTLFFSPISSVHMSACLCSCAKDIKKRGIFNQYNYGDFMSRFPLRITNDLNICVTIILAVLFSLTKHPHLTGEHWKWHKLTYL